MVKYAAHVAHVGSLVGVLTPVGKFLLSLLILVDVAIVAVCGALGALSLSGTIRVRGS